MVAEYTTLECPYCRQAGARYQKRVGRPPNEDKSPSVFRRKYLCPCGRDFFTLETQEETPLVNVKINTSPFDRMKLRQSIAKATAKKRLTEDEINTVVDVATRQLEASIAKLEPSTELRLHAATVVDAALEGFLAVARRQRETGYRRDALLAAHVQYALATRGTTWRNAAAFLQWMRTETEYHGWARKAPSGPDGPRPTRSWVVPPSDPPTKIQTVIKNTFANPTPGDGIIAGGQKDMRHRDREVFDADKLSRTIRAALRGRPREHDAAQLERGVLWALTGQDHVRSSQISTLVSEALRCIDDIAYLRWVMVGKELDARTVVDEAVGLVAHPSPELLFASDDARIPWAIGTTLTA